MIPQNKNKMNPKECRSDEICFQRTITKLLYVLFSMLPPFFVINNIKSISQHRFMQNNNTTTTIFELTDTALNAIEEEKIPFGFCSDMSKALNLTLR